MWPSEDIAGLLADFHAIEPVVQRDGGLSYRRVLERSLRALAVARGLPLAEGDATALADSLPDWPAFAEVPAALARLRADGWRLAILSNTDPGYLAASIARVGVDIDERVVASEIGSYKPGHRHWEELRRRIGAGPVVHVHVAASLFHDIEPCADLGITSVWINRLGETSSRPPGGRATDLHDLSATLARLGAGT